MRACRARRAEDGKAPRRDPGRRYPQAIASGAFLHLPTKESTRWHRRDAAHPGQRVPFAAKCPGCPRALNFDPRAQLTLTLEYSRSSLNDCESLLPASCIRRQEPLAYLPLLSRFDALAYPPPVANRVPRPPRLPTEALDQYAVPVMQPPNLALPVPSDPLLYPVLKKTNRKVHHQGQFPAPTTLKKGQFLMRNNTELKRWLTSQPIYSSLVTQPTPKPSPRRIDREQAALPMQKMENSC